jgi:iron complex outermembrane receptor protein
MGVRQDSATHSKPSTSPRLGIIWQSSPTLTAKFLAGRAYRSPNAYESEYSQGQTYLSNPGLVTETILTNEFVLEWVEDAKTKWMLSLFNNKIDHIIHQVDMGGGGAGPFQYQNSNWHGMNGAELGLEKNTPANFKLRASVAYNHVQNDLVTNQGYSPKWIGKFSAGAPVFNNTACLTGEIQDITHRNYTWNAASYSLGSEILANATLSFPNVLAKGLQLQFRVTNLFNRHIADPAASEMPTPFIPQDGLNLLAKLDYAF